MSYRHIPDIRMPFAPSAARWASLPLRLVLGFGFLAHGYAKIQHGPEQFAALLGSLGTPAPDLAAWITIMIELVGGAAVVAGAFLPVVSLPLAAVMLVAAFTVHLQYGFSSIKLQAVTQSGAKFGPPGYEVDLLYIAGLAALAIGGSGPYSVDSYLRSRSKEGRGATGARAVRGGM